MENNVLIKRWKEDMRSAIIMKYKNKLTDHEIEMVLENQINKKLKDPKVVLVNNYTNKFAHLNFTALVDIIEDQKLICAGSGCLYLPHGRVYNLLADFILWIMGSRKDAKKQRKMCEAGSWDWSNWDRIQGDMKLLINSLYGCGGYPGFNMFNVFNAEATTNQGRQIITSGIHAVENFLGDAMHLTSETEAYHMINNIERDIKASNDGQLSSSALAMFENNLDFTKLPQLVLERFIKHSKFSYDSKYINSLSQIFFNMSIERLIFYYYKNNYDAFTNLPIVKSKIKELVLSNGALIFCEMENYKDDKCRDISTQLTELYEKFVYYDYAVYDRVRKALYIDKTASLYTDTDSVFFSVNKMVKFVNSEIFPNVNDSGLIQRELNYTSANILLTVMNHVIDRSLKKLCKDTNISDEMSLHLQMKNESFNERVMFTSVKKRYVLLMLLSEGEVLNNGNGKIKIKGFDFIKSTTKPFVKDYLSKICEDDIMRVENINITEVFKKVLILRNGIADSIMSGDTKFFKQSNVKIMEAYKNPYSTQGVMAILLWNTLCPDLALELPNDVNIVPITPLTFPKIKPKDDMEKVTRTIVKTPMDYKPIASYANKHPEAYDKLYKSIYTNTNGNVRHMTMTSIAIPKNLEHGIPEHIMDIISIDTIINNTVNLFLPIMKDLGMHTFRINSTSETLSNIVTL